MSRSLRARSGAGAPAGAMHAMSAAKDPRVVDFIGTYIPICSQTLCCSAIASQMAEPVQSSPVRSNGTP
jgi:hypothetical protein